MGTGELKRSRGRRGHIGAGVASLLVGALVGLAPFWLSAGGDLDPPGAACWFEHDPGSGRSAVGVERVDRGLAPQRVCTVIGPVELPTSGPEFDAAVERSRLDTDPATPPDEARTFPLLGRVWPLAVLVVAAGVWTVGKLVAWQLRVDRRTMDAVDGRHR